MRRYAKILSFGGRKESESLKAEIWLLYYIDEERLVVSAGKDQHQFLEPTDFFPRKKGKKELERFKRTFLAPQYPSERNKIPKALVKRAEREFISLSGGEMNKKWDDWSCE